ncbi:MAG: hypothetical protein COB85_08430 [Bacteroidetes bacterium]|nr:MAG: hypothetical protein COB85_08430 [Bacteroidota bacterium]
MKKHKLEIIGLSYSQTQSGAYALVLGEEAGKRRLPIIIGSFEAQAIAIELEKMKPSRPLTHDLFKTFADSFDVTINEVIIYNLVEGIFFAKLICDRDGKEVEIDARTSDSIALAIRFNCPIYTYEFILSAAGIILEESEEIEDVIEKGIVEEFQDVDEDDEPAESEDLSNVSVKKLEAFLKQAISDEAYEDASKIKKEIDKRKKK